MDHEEGCDPWSSHKVIFLEKKTRYSLMAYARAQATGARPHEERHQMIMVRPFRALHSSGYLRII